MNEKRLDDCAGEGKSAATTKHTHHKSQSHKYELLVRRSLFLNVERCTIKHQVRSFTSSFLDRSTVLPSMLCPILFVHICINIHIRV